MGMFLRLLALGLAAVAGATATVFIMNKKHENDPDNCGMYLAFGRKKLIEKMNKDIKDREERTSPENHMKTQKELENVNWDGGSCSF